MGMGNPQLVEAVLDLVREAMTERNTKRGYARVCKALQTMCLEREEVGRVLNALSYADDKGKPHRWLLTTPLER